MTVPAGMAALFICSLTVPHAVDDGGIVFGAGYLALTAIHAVGCRLFADTASRRAILRILPFNLGAAELILAAGWTHGARDCVTALSDRLAAGRRMPIAVAGSSR